MHTILIDVCGMQVQSDFFQPTIVVLAFPSQLLEVGILTTDEASDYLEYMSSLAMAIDQQNITNTHLLQLDGQSLNVTDWCAAHPNAAAHQVIASQVVDFLGVTYPELSTTTFPNAVNLTNK